MQSTYSKVTNTASIQYIIKVSKLLLNKKNKLILSAVVFPTVPILNFKKYCSITLTLQSCTDKEPCRKIFAKGQKFYIFKIIQKQYSYFHLWNSCTYISFVGTLKFLIIMLHVLFWEKFPWNHRCIKLR